MRDRVTISDLRLKARVGWGDEERAVPQWILVDVVIEIDSRAAAASDDLADTVDYHATIERIAALVEGTEAKLLESLAAKVADAIAADPGALGVTVEIRKESPPVDREVGGISVRIERPGA